MKTKEIRSALVCYNKRACNFEKRRTRTENCPWVAVKYELSSKYVARWRKSAKWIRSNENDCFLGHFEYFNSNFRRIACPRFNNEISFFN